MKWDYWMALYLNTHCTARGLRAKTIEAYKVTLEGFRNYIKFRAAGKEPDEVSAKDVLEYVDYLRRERKNGDSAVNRQVTVLRNFYRAIVAMGYLEPNGNPLAYFPRLKQAPRKVADALSDEEVKKLLAEPRTDTIIGLRDRAIIILLYGTGIRASECAGLCEQDVDFSGMRITVTGKGGHQRGIPLSEEVADALRAYRNVRENVKPTEGFFRSRKKAAMSRNAIYERVRTHARRARIERKVSPHRLRHTFATDLVRVGVKLVTIRDLLGHRQLSSTQIYLHTTAEELRYAAEKHPVTRLVDRVAELLPGVRVAFQSAPKKRSG